MKNTLSVCLIVKNEEKNIERCLVSVANYANQIVIVDTGSTDKTVDILKKYNVDIFYHKWNNDFSEARNNSIKYAISDWILIIDADEIIDLYDLNLSKYDENIGGLRVNIKNFISQDLQSFSTHKYTRIFRNHRNFCFEGKIHEQINESILKSNFEIVDTDIEITHFGYINTSIEKKNRNRELLENSDLNDSFNNLNYADTLFSLGENDKALEIYTKLVKSTDLTNFQIEHIVIRIGQIYLKQNRFLDVKNILNFNSEFNDLEGLRKYVLAAALMSNKELSEAKTLYLELINSTSGLIDKDIIYNALSLLEKLKI